MFAIQDHLLAGQSPGGHAVERRDSPNHNGEIRPRFLVFHYTGCNAAAASAAFLRGTGSNRVSAHLLVDADGSVTQFVRLNRRAWHAGESRWNGYHDLNTHSIGIEVVNFGYLLKTAAGTFQTAEARQPIAASQVIEARHRLPHWPWSHWHGYTPEQIETCEALAEALVLAYGLQDVLGHDDIAPTRKSDPGPAFPLGRMRSLAFGRDGDASTQQAAYVAVDRLNIRRGAGPGFERAGPPLVRNTQLQVLAREPNGWMRVVTSQAEPLEGWVLAAYTSEQLS